MSEEMEFRRYVLGTNTKYRPNYQNGLTYDTFEQAKDAAQRFAEKEHKTMYIFERMEVTSLVGEVRADEENIHREREQAYMQGYEDACKKYRKEPKTGHWIEEDMFDGDVAYRCSECNELFWIESGTPKDNEYNYCPKCGKRLV